MAKSIAELYQNILGRAPDPSGAAFWQQQFGNEIDPTEIARFTAEAQKELAQRPPGLQLINNRDPNAPGYVGPRPTVPFPGQPGGDFVDTRPPSERPNFGGTGNLPPGMYGQPYFPEPSMGGPVRPAPPSIPIGMQVADLYEQYLGRPADPGGLEFWTNLFGNEIDPEELMRFKTEANKELGSRPIKAPTEPVFQPTPAPSRPNLPPGIVGLPPTPVFQPTPTKPGANLPPLTSFQPPAPNAPPPQIQARSAVQETAPFPASTGVLPPGVAAPTSISLPAPAPMPMAAPTPQMQPVGFGPITSGMFGGSSFLPGVAQGNYTPFSALLQPYGMRGFGNYGFGPSMPMFEQPMQPQFNMPSMPMLQIPQPSMGGMFNQAQWYAPQPFQQAPVPVSAPAPSSSSRPSTGMEGILSLLSQYMNMTQNRPPAPAPAPSAAPAPAPSAAPAPAPASSGMTLAQLYQNVLGRAPDAGGLAFWQQQFGNEIDPAEIARFTAEAQKELAQRPSGPRLVNTSGGSVFTPIPPAEPLNVPGYTVSPFLADTEAAGLTLEQQRDRYGWTDDYYQGQKELEATRRQAGWIR